MTPLEALAQELYEHRRTRAVYVDVPFHAVQYITVSKEEFYQMAALILSREAALRAERDQLGKNLYRYGHHDHNCDHPNVYSQGVVCKCGFNAALDALLEEPKP